VVASGSVKEATHSTGKLKYFVPPMLDHWNVSVQNNTPMFRTLVLCPEYENLVAIAKIYNSTIITHSSQWKFIHIQNETE
jgi:hypothetical protein